MNTKMRKIIFTLFLLAGISSNTLAGSQANEEPNFEAERVIKFAKKVEKSAAEKGAHVIILARKGRPKKELPSGIEYTHVAFGVYSIITAKNGDKVPGYAIYNLYQREDELDTSDLVVDYPVDFFMGVHELQAGIIIPTPEVQRRLLKVINSDTYKKLHNPEYSVISNPYNLKFQNCTEHTLDVITASIYETEDRQLIKASISAYYDAQKVKINPFKLMLGSMTKSDVRLADHRDRAIETSTFTTIARFMQAHELAAEVFMISEDAGV